VELTIDQRAELQAVVKVRMFQRPWRHGRAS